jgi:hypothetical protein
VFNWLDRMGFMPQSQYRVFMRGDGKTMVRARGFGLGCCCVGLLLLG